MQMPDQDTINSLLRQGCTAAGTALTIGTLVAVVPQEAVQPTIAAAAAPVNPAPAQHWPDAPPDPQPGEA
jgi:hypothetical protein